jgi:ABC-type multidrug transport system permease subunit
MAAVDFYIDTISRPPSNGGTWKDLYEASKFASNYRSSMTKLLASGQEKDRPLECPNSTVRFLALCDFFFRYYSRDLGFHLFRINFLIAMALYLGSVFFRLEVRTSYLARYTGAIFFGIWAVLFSAVTSTALLAKDRRQAIELVKNGVFTPGLYSLAQFVVSCPFNMVTAIIFQIIYHWMTSMNDTAEPFFYAVLITHAHLMLMEGIMLTVVVILKDAMLCVSFAMIVLGFLVLFSGYFITRQDMPKWIGWLNWITPTTVSSHSMSVSLASCN